jgi:hypothetical protein
MPDAKSRAPASALRVRRYAVVLNMLSVQGWAIAGKSSCRPGALPQAVMESPTVQANEQASTDPFASNSVFGNLQR